MPEVKEIKCPKCNYSTPFGIAFAEHLYTYHPKEAFEILCDLVDKGKIKVEVC